MDYLDPNKKRRKKNQLLIMYALLGVAIAIATLVVVYNVNGYSIDRQTGEVIQNGLIYLDSKPESAEVYLNGEKQKGRTDSRLVAQEGVYKIELKRDGYRQWERSLTLEGGSLRRLTYARLVPEAISSDALLNLPVTPSLVSQSNDKRWLVFFTNDNPLLMYMLDLERPQAEIFPLQLAVDFLKSKGPGVWEVIDWADDDKTFLATYTTATGVEAVLINREDATRSLNVNTIYPNIAISEVQLWARKNDLVYLYDKNSATVYRANLTEKTTETALNGVLDYKSYGEDAFLYITKGDAKEGMVQAALRVADKTYRLRDIQEDDKYLLAISKLGNAYVIGVGSPKENRVIVYNDPIHAIDSNDFSTIPVPTTVLNVPTPVEVQISADSSVILARNANEGASHEFEADRSYAFNFTKPVRSETELSWVDGRHLLYLTEAGALQMSDFEGSNSYELVASADAKLGYFDRTMDLLFTVALPAEGNTTPALLRHYMRTEADR